MTFKFNSDDWVLESCSYCDGRGTVGGHFKDIDSLRQCPECFGNRTISVAPKYDKPVIPEGLKEHTRRA